MQLKESKTITLHDVSPKKIHDKLLTVLKEAEEDDHCRYRTKMPRRLKAREPPSRVANVLVNGDWHSRK